MERFKLESLLGNGSYSDVYKAKNLETGQDVALKIMKQPYSSNKTSQDMELYTLRKFGSLPSVIDLKESFNHEGYLCLVFELLDINLIDYYKQLKSQQGRQLTEQEIQSVLYQIAFALEAMHKDGYAHRDIKPENVLIREVGSYLEAKLTDFGLTKKLLDGRNTNYVATRWYRSPELLLNMKYDLTVDVFAFGCLMVELYLGFQPFPGNDTVDQLNKIFSILGSPTESTWPQGTKVIKDRGISFQSYEPIDLQQNIPGISPEGVDLIYKTLVNNPKKRLSTSQILNHPYFANVFRVLPQNFVGFANQFHYLPQKYRPKSASISSGLHINLTHFQSHHYRTASNKVQSEKTNTILGTFEKVETINIPTTTTRDVEIQSVTTQMALSMTNTQHSIVRQFSPNERVIAHKGQQNPEKVIPAKDIIKDIYSFEYQPEEQTQRVSIEKPQRPSPSIIINYTNRAQPPSVSPPARDYRNRQVPVQHNILRHHNITLPDVRKKIEYSPPRQADLLNRKILMKSNYDYRDKININYQSPPKNNIIDLPRVPIYKKDQSRIIAVRHPIPQIKTEVRNETRLKSETRMPIVQMTPIVSTVDSSPMVEQRRFEEPKWCDGFCDFFRRDDYEVEYTIGQRSRYRQQYYEYEEEQDTCKRCFYVPNY